MKIKANFFICLFVVLAMAAFVSCSEPNENYKTSGSAYNFKDISGLKHVRTNIRSSTAAVGKLEWNLSRSASRGPNSFQDYYIVKIEEGNSSTEPVTFTATQNVTINGKTINVGDDVSQEGVIGSVDKVYVAGDYVLISYLNFNLNDLLSTNLEYINGAYHGGFYDEYQISSNEWIIPSFTFDFAPDFDSVFLRYMDHGIGINYSEHMTLRCDQNMGQAFNEYNGVAIYDTFDYYTSMFRSSFIIDINTGYIYSIPEEIGGNKINLSVHHGAVIDANLGPVMLSVNGNGELELEQIIANKDIGIGDVFRDRYDQYYVLADGLSETDENIVFFDSIGEYIPTEDGRVIHVTSSLGGLSFSFVGANFTETSLSLLDEAGINYSTISGGGRIVGLYAYNNADLINSWHYHGYDYESPYSLLVAYDSYSYFAGTKLSFRTIEDGFVYYDSTKNGHMCYRYNIETGDTDSVDIGSGRYVSLDGKYFIYGQDAGSNKIDIIQTDPFEGTETQILAGVTKTNWQYCDNALDMTFDVIGRSGTDKYKIVKTGADSFEAALESSTLVETTKLKLQPINR